MIREVIHRLAAQQDLSKQESYETVNEIMSGNAFKAQVAAFSMDLRLKGETVEEMSGCSKSTSSATGSAASSGAAFSGNG